MGATALWEALSSVSDVGVGVADRIGFLRSVNARFWAVLGWTEPAPIGTHLSEVLPVPIADELIGVTHQVLQTSRPICVDTIVGGCGIRFSFHPADAETEDASLVLMCLERHPLVTGSAPGIDFARSTFIDLGPLGLLSERELEVLALIGAGYSVREIAKVLHRSPKTIENHRASIASKLGAHDRVELAILARAAGLVGPESVEGRVRTRRARDRTHASRPIGVRHTRDGAL